MVVIGEGENFRVRYLFNPSGRGRFMLSEYEDNDLISEDVWRNAERRLGVMLREH